MKKDGLLKCAKTPSKKTQTPMFGTRKLTPPNEPLQYVQEPKKLTEFQEMLVYSILCKPFLSEEAKGLSKEEKQYLSITITEALNNLASQDLDRLKLNIDELMPTDVKKQIWEQNHQRIVRAISLLTEKSNRFPARGEIANESGLSRQTVNKHLKQYYASEEHKHKKEEFIIMRERVLASMFLAAKNGSTKAARLFLECTVMAEEPKSLPWTIKNQQNNLIYFNGTAITHEQINQLPPDKQAQLQELLLMVTEKAILNQ